jgi:hypothetical protein
MLQRIDYEDKEDPNPRATKLDIPLKVSKWKMPGSHIYKKSSESTGGTDSNIPDWWSGDEDASQSFLNAMNIER